MKTERSIEQELTLWAAKQPRTEAATLMLRAVDVIYDLRAALKNQQDNGGVSVAKTSLAND